MGTKGLGSFSLFLDTLEELFFGINSPNSSLQDTYTPPQADLFCAHPANIAGGHIKSDRDGLIYFLKASGIIRLLRGERDPMIGKDGAI